MAVSGKCYLSLHELGASANRGACMQVCRRGYEVARDDEPTYLLRDKESTIELEVDNKYVMSPKDLKTIRFMDEMMEAGVRVFKIEGRARGPEYVRTVVECYSEAINSYIDGTFSEEKKDEWDERLRTVFNRGFWNGYYLGQRLGNGLATMAPMLQNERYMQVRAYATSQISAWQNFSSKQLSYM
jgi:putative protease